VAQFSKRGAFFQFWGIFQVWHTFPFFVHFAKCGASFQGCLILPTVRHFSKCYTFFQVLRIFFKRGAFFQVWGIFPFDAHFAKCGASFQGCLILPTVSVTRFFKCCAFF